MYKKIIIPLENSATDEIILSHIRGLAKLCNSHLLLLHVADGFMARNQKGLNLAESEEMLKDREYLELKSAELKQENFNVSYVLLCGDPAEQILKSVEEQECDLIAMATHGHGPLGDFVLGTVAEKVRHKTSVPILMIRAPK